LLPAQVQSAQKLTAENAARIERALAESGHKYNKEAEAVWSISVTGKNRPLVRTVVDAKNEVMACDGLIALAEEVADHPALMRRLLQLNAAVAGATLAIDADGDYVARQWLSVNELTSRSFEKCVTGAATAADDVFAAIGSLLAKPTGAPGSSGEPVTGGADVAGLAAPAARTTRVEALGGIAGFEFESGKVGGDSVNGVGRQDIRVQRRERLCEADRGT